MLPATTRRVEQHTPAAINRARQGEIRDSIEWHRRHPERVPARLAALDREWDIERALEANAAAVALIGLGLTAFADRRFVILPAAVAAFLLQHALQGWCPPLPILRRLGVRTRREIEAERRGLLALPGAAAAPAADGPRETVDWQGAEVHEGV